MLETLKELSNPWIAIVDLTLLIIVAAWLWEKAARPAWRALKGLVKQRERQDKLNLYADHWDSEADVQLDAKRWKVLGDVADFLEPNGKTLAEHLDENDKAHVELFRHMEEIGNKIDSFIVDRKPNGKRRNDPHE